MNIIWIVLVAVVLGALGQISFKNGLNKVRIVGTRQIVSNIFRVFTNAFVVSGVALYGLSSLLWLFSMTRLDISFMYPLISLSYLVTTLFAIIFLGEKVKYKRWIGLGLIIVGSFFIMAGV